jgi:hypothetical protein
LKQGGLVVYGGGELARVIVKEGLYLPFTARIPGITALRVQGKNK